MKVETFKYLLSIVDKVMVSLPVYDKKGNSVGTVSIEATDIASTINRQLLHDVVVMYQANLRQGTHKTKTRSEVAGTTKKMYRQKGTGNARAGSRRSGIRRGGGHIHALTPRDYYYRLPKKAIRAATRMALAGKLQADQIVVIDSFGISAPKTKELADILKALKIYGSTTLITTEALDGNVYKSARNIAGVEVLPASDLNALAVIKPSKLLITKAALESFRKSAS